MTLSNPVIYTGHADELVYTGFLNLKEFAEELYIRKIQSYWRIWEN
jgi:hypothetical protein